MTCLLRIDEPWASISCSFPLNPLVPPLLQSSSLRYDTHFNILQLRRRTRLKPSILTLTSMTFRASHDAEAIQLVEDIPFSGKEQPSALQVDPVGSPSSFDEDFLATLDAEMLSALQNRKTDEAWHIFERFSRKKQTPSSVCLSRLVAQLSHIGTPSSLSKAQILVASLQKRGNASLLDCNCLGLLAMATSKAGAAQYAASIIRLMLKSGLYPHVKAWSAVVSKLGKDKEDASLALSLFEQILSLLSDTEIRCDTDLKSDRQDPYSFNSLAAMRPDTGAFNAALNACANACMVDKANDVLKKLSMYKLKPDVLTFNIMIKLYAMSDNTEKLSTVLQEMQSAGVKPCVSTIHSLVAAYVGLDELERAVALVRALKAGRQDIGTILSCDMMLIDPFAETSVNDGDSVSLELMPPPKPADGDNPPHEHAPLIPKFKPDTRMYTIIMKGYMQKGKLQEVKQLLTAMQNQDDTDTHPNEVTYTTVISTCARLGLLDEARSMLREMIAQKVPANVVTYNVLFKGYCEAGHIVKARMLLEDMRKAGIQPDVVSFNTLIDGYINVEDSSSALAMFTQMREAGIAPSKASYTSLIKAFGNKAQPSLAAKVFEEMEQDRRVKVDIIAWNALIDCYGKAGHVEGAKETFRRMKEAGHVPTVATYGSLVKAFALGAKGGEALVLWKEIKERLESEGEKPPPLEPDGGLLDGLVDICVRQGFFLKALEILACMEKHQIPADKIKYKRMFVELHSKLYTSPHTSQARRDRTAQRRRAVEAFKFWVGLPNNYYGRDWSP